jgi:hypothetical protein
MLPSKGCFPKTLGFLQCRKPQGLMLNRTIQFSKNMFLMTRTSKSLEAKKPECRMFQSESASQLPSMSRQTFIFALQPRQPFFKIFFEGVQRNSANEGRNMLLQTRECKSFLNIFLQTLNGIY